VSAQGDGSTVMPVADRAFSECFHQFRWQGPCPNLLQFGSQEQ